MSLSTRIRFSIFRLLELFGLRAANSSRGYRRTQNYDDAMHSLKGKFKAGRLPSRDEMNER
jgi:hypothetical protein